MTEVWGIPLVGFTAPALLGITVMLILTGRLIPRVVYDEKAREANKWHEAHQVSEAARLAQTQQMDAVLEVGETVRNVLNALDRVRNEDHGS